jgi:DNA topoisomerase-1
VRYENKFVSIKDDDPYTITLDRALELVAAKKEADANKVILTFPGSEIQVLNGFYGPYITNGKKNAKIPKDREPASLTLQECEELIAAAPERRSRAKKKSVKKKAAKKVTGGKKKVSRKKTGKKKASTKTPPPSGNTA